MRMRCDRLHQSLRSGAGCIVCTYLCICSDGQLLIFSLCIHICMHMPIYACTHRPRVFYALPELQIGLESVTTIFVFCMHVYAMDAETECVCECE